jgi:hypothetical protein
MGKFSHDLKWSKLVEQGIEPNPGPFRIKACSLNTGGMESTVKIMDMLSEAAYDSIGNTQGGCALIVKKCFPCISISSYSASDGQAISCQLGKIL